MLNAPRTFYWEGYNFELNWDMYSRRWAWNPYLLSEQRKIEMEVTLDSIAIFGYSHLAAWRIQFENMFL